ncbi:hypothetical protein [Niallia sp. 03133]
MLMIFRYIIISFFSLTAVSLLGYQMIEFTHAIIDVLLNKKDIN